MKRGKPILGLTFTLLAAAILLFAAPASASYELIAKWGSAGSGDGQFSGHLGVATDSKDNVYVADSGNHRIQKFDSSGNFLAAWGSSSWGIATDSMDNVYVTDGSFEIQKFDSSGNFLAAWLSIGAEFVSSGQVATDSNDDVYVSGEVYNPCLIFGCGRTPSAPEDPMGRIQKFDSSGNFLTAWGTPGSGDGQFGGVPGGIATDSEGSVYVADGGNNRIQKFNSSGTFITKWGGGGTFFGLGAIATDSKDNVYAAEPKNNRIQVFDSSGSFLEQFGSPGSGDGKFNNPEGIATDSQGNVYVADTENNRIQKFAEVPPDTTLRGSATAKGTQIKSGPEIKVRVRVEAQEKLSVEAKGIVKIKPVYRLKPKTANVAADQGMTLKLTPKKKHGKKIAKALKKGKKATAKLEVKLTDEAGNTETENLKVKLKR